MLQRCLRATICFLLVLAGYWAYAIAVVPRIEPAATRSGNAPSTPTYLVTNRNLDRFFPEGAWERDQPKVLETGEFFLLFRDYKPGAKNTMEVKPVTLLYFPADEGDRRVPIIIQSPAGAIVESDRAINPARAVFGKPIRARLPGRVEIRRAGSSDGADDELFVATQNIQVDRNRIWTPHEVEFRFGSHRGRGKDLQIRLHSRDARGATLRKQIGVFRDLELAQVERVYLAPTAGLLDRGTSANEKSQGENPQIEIECDGAFRFDLVNQIASLHDNVRLTRKYPQYTDSLTCSLLEIHLKSDTEVQAAVLSAPKDEPSLTAKELSVDRLLARGSPVVLEAPSEQTYARAEYAEIYYAERRIVVESKRGAWLRHGQSEMESRKLDYTLDPHDDQRPGKLVAEGPGRIRGLSEGASGQAFEATWGEGLLLQPDGDAHVLRLMSRATVQFTGMGGFSADEINLFLVEAPQSLNKLDATAPRENRFQLRPDRLIATGNVLVDSVWLQSKAPSQELKVWFVPEGGVVAEDPAQRTAPDSSVPSSDERPVENAPPSPARPTGPPLEFQGDFIEALVLDGDRFRLDDMTVGGRVRISRAPQKPGDSPLIVSGDLLRIRGAANEQTIVEVSGRPAEAGAEGLLLRGEHIVLDQRNNLMTIPGPGEMHTKARSLPGEQRGGERSVPAMVIIWNNSLEFDGLVAQFHGHIRVNGSSAFEDGDVAAFRIDGQEMRAELTERLSFVDPPDDDAAGKVDLATLTFPDDVVMQNRTTDRAGELQSTEHMEVKTLVLDQRTGDLTARGPGQLSSVRRGMPAPAPGRSAQSELTNVQVHYQNAIQGNLVQREIEFQGRVHALYGPVNNWNERLDRDRGPIGSDAFHLHSETLKLTEMPAPDARSKPHYEILATQAVEVHGESFDAFGETLHYDASKALLILNGTEREPARIDSDWENGRAKAKSIRIWHKDQRVKLENIQQFQIGPFSNRPGVQR